MNVPVLWVSLHRERAIARGYADQGLLECIFDRSIWTPRQAIEFDHYEVGENDWPDVEGAVVMIPARHHVGDEDQLYEMIRTRLRWAVVMFCGDEEGVFYRRGFTDVATTLAHQTGGPDTNTKWRFWFMQPLAEHEKYSLVPGGWYPKTHEYLRDIGLQDPSLEWFFGGQVTHERREAVASQLRERRDGALVETPGYLQEVVPRDEYFRLMASAKVIPSPSGPAHMDTARTFEALEAQCLPICDTRTPSGLSFNYWDLLFGVAHGLPVVEEWDGLADRIKRLADGWPANANRTTAMWHEWKMRTVCKLDAQIRTLAKQPIDSQDPNDVITCIVTTSPIESHPDLYHIRTTVESIRAQLPTAMIVIVADGVRVEQEYLRDKYEQYLRSLLWTANFEWHNVLVVIQNEFGHQANSVRRGLEYVDTPLVFMAEHDTPVKGDIPWSQLVAECESGYANVIRLHHEASILPSHECMMLGVDREQGDTTGTPLIRTRAWWQRPHLARTDFYHARVMTVFPEASRTFIEDKLYGLMLNDFSRRGDAAWWDWRVFVYAPEGDMQMSWHTNGRGSEGKYEMRFS